MPTVYLSPIGNSQQVDSSGVPRNLAKLYTYAAGSTTPRTTYTDSTGNTAQANPIILNSLGLPDNPIWLPTGQTKFVLKTPADVTIWTEDNVTGINDVSLSVSEWQASGLTPTYISSTQFSFSGDQTQNCLVGRRLLSTNTAGTVYSRITAASFGAGITTVTVASDSGVLDSGLSAVSYGLLTPSNPSYPVLLDSAALFMDNSDKSKLLAFQLSNITTATTRTLTVPDASGTIALTSNKLSAFAATTSAELASVISDETGSGAAVFANTPTLVTPNIGAATGTSVAVTGNMGFASGSKFYLDGVTLNGDTYISETGPNVMTFTAGGSAGLSLTSSAFNIAVGAAVSGGNLTLSGANNLIIPAAQYLYLDGGGDTYITEASANVTAFATGGTERARITASGYTKMSNTGTYVNATGAYHEFKHDANSLVLSISNSNATMNSTITGINVYYSGAAPNSTVACFMYNEDTGGLRSSLRSNGGLANYSANNVNLSDERLKKDIVDAPSYYEKWKQIKFRTFLYKDQTDSELNLGVIAQELEAVCPELISNDGFGESPTGEAPLKTVYQTDFQYATGKALQEAIVRIEQLEERLAALEAK